MHTLPPLSLYVHIPWCVQKCPYCDFNSHGLKQAVPEQEYISHLLQDLQQDAELVPNREVQTIFIGGGTPSLFSAEAMADLLHGIKQRIPLAKDAEITMEANPGTFEKDRFAGFVQAGINRISIGVQSFQNDKLTTLGRIHGPTEAVAAAQHADTIGLNSFNLDLMHGLPGQNIDEALDDLQRAIALSPPHLSWYQLTIEPNTLFHSKPPTLPEDEILWDIQERGESLLKQNGYEQYEVSAYSKPGFQCQHNLNYWRFGDYLGVGCGAHGKITDLNTQQITRTEKVKHPKGYMDLTKSYTFKSWQVQKEDLPFEFFMNRFRLLEPCPVSELEMYTGLSTETPIVRQAIDSATTKGLMTENQQEWYVTRKGRLFLNELLNEFL
ncbi:MAG: radical SAM family heme chaperone HemW [Aestuariibacter sp.]